MTRYLLILGNAMLALLWTLYAIVVAICIVGCKSPAPVEPVTEQPREPRPTPVAPHSAYVPYTNSQQDRLVERHELIGPPVVPGRGPFPLILPQPSVSNWLTPKTMIVQPKPFPALKTNELGHVVLTRLTVTPNNGGPTFVASLEGEARPTVQADANVAVVIIPVNFTNYIIEASERMGGDTNWRVMSSGVVFNTNGHVVFIDVHGGTKPHQFFKQQPAP